MGTNPCLQAFCEVSQDQSPGTPAAAGDFGFKVLTSSDPAEKTKKLSAELANGRLAMMAIIGMFFQARMEQHPRKFVKRIQLSSVCYMLLHTPLVIYIYTYVHTYIHNLHAYTHTHRGWPHRQRLGRLGELHRVALALMLLRPEFVPMQRP